MVSRARGWRAGALLIAECVLGTSCAARDNTPRTFTTFFDEQTATTAAATDEIVANSPSNNQQGPAETLPESAEPHTAVTRLTLSDAVAECLAADPRIRSGAATFQQARAELWTASLLPNPTLDTGGSLLPLGQPFNVTHQGGPPQFDVGIAFPIDWLVFGKRSAAIDTAQAGVDVAAAEFANLVRERLAATVSAFYTVLQAKALLEIATRDFDSFKRLQDITAELVRYGGAGTIENDRVQVSLLDSQREMRRREADLSVAKAALLSQLGRHTPSTDFVVDGNLDVPAPVPPLSSDQAFEIARHYRPDIVAAQLRIDAATREAEKAKTEAYPDVTPHVGYTRQFQEKSIGFPDVNAFGVGVDLALPVFDRNQGNIEKANFALAAARSGLRTELVDVRAEIEEANQDYRFAYEAVTADAPLRIAAARNARDKIENAYQAGGRPLIDVLDAQRAYRDTERLDVEDRAGYWQSLYRLNAAVGKEVLR